MSLNLDRFLPNNSRLSVVVFNISSLGSVLPVLVIQYLLPLLAQPRLVIRFGAFIFYTNRNIVSYSFQCIYITISHVSPQCTYVAPYLTQSSSLAKTLMTLAVLSPSLSTDSVAT